MTDESRDITSRRRSEKVLRSIIEGTSLSVGEDYFRSLVRHLANALDVRSAFVSELHEQREGRLRLLAFWSGNDFEEIYEYDSEGTPCELVIKKGLVCYPDNVQNFFPEDQWLKDSHIESYLAIPLLDLDGKPIGHLGVAHDKPLTDTLSAQSILQVFSTRAGAELLRTRAEQALQLAHDELEIRVKHRTADLEKANEQLKEEFTERRWMTHIYRASPIGLCCFDTELRYIDINEWLAALNGISIDEHLGRTINEVLPDVATGVELQLRHVIETGKPIVNGEVIAATPANPHVKRHFLHNYYPLKSNTGDIVGISCAIQDITERKRAEEALQTAKEELEDRVKQRTKELEESNEHLRTEMASRERIEQNLQQTHQELNHILESMPDGIIITDATGKIVLGNSQAENLFGYERGDLVSVMIERLVPVNFREGHVSQRNSYIANPHPRTMGQSGKLFGLHRDGSEFPVEISLSPMQTEAGLLICAAVRDVTQRVRVEDALRASEEQARLVLDSTAEAIYGLDLQGYCTFCNRACMETLGYDSVEELLGQNMHNLIHHTRSDGSPYPVHECKIYEAIRLGEGTHVDDELLWKADGSSFPAEYRSFPIRRDGELIGSVVTFLDITEQKRVAEALSTQQSELTHAARLSTLGEMAAGLAHELNQPLTAMSAFAEGALARLDRGKLRETEIAKVFSRIAEDAQRAGDIIRRLRNFVQKREAQRHQIDVNHLVRDVYKFVASDAKQQGITILFELENGLPAVEADPIEIQQVLLNLIRNAFDALARNNSNERRIVIFSYGRNPDRVEVVVEDSGLGISDHMAEQVFEPFYTSKADGLGIGLGICQRIIEAHGGKMWLGYSSLGGAGVHFDLPSRQQEDETNAS